jgi:hypothetical protein
MQLQGELVPFGFFAHREAALLMPFGFFARLFSADAIRVLCSEPCKVASIQASKPSEATSLLWKHHPSEQLVLAH